MRYGALTRRMCPTSAWYCSRRKLKPRSNQRKNGRNRRKPVSAASCPLATGLRSEAQSTGVRINATTTDSIIEEMMVMENWR